jgi:hypothetical protein
MQNTRWGDLITVVQDIINDLKTEQIDLLKNKFNINTMTNLELKEMVSKFGYSLLSLSGYTSSTRYLKKQLETIVLRIQNKNTRIGYKYILYVYDLKGDLYPIYLTDGSIFKVWDEYWNRKTSILAQERTLDENETYTLDNTDPYWINSLDQSGSSLTILRHLVLSYQFKYIENSLEFLSVNSCRSIYNDVQQMKRATELIYFEPKLIIQGNLNKTLKTTTYNTYDNSASTTMKSILISGSGLLSFNHVQFGNSTRTSFASGTISGVVSLVNTLRTTPSGQLEFIETKSQTLLHCRQIITDKQKFPNSITELSLHDSTSGCIFYSTFPAIKFYDRMNSNLSFKINLI